MKRNPISALLTIGAILGIDRAAAETSAIKDYIDRRDQQRRESLFVPKAAPTTKQEIVFQSRMKQAAKADRRQARFNQMKGK